MWSESSCSDFTKTGHHLKYHIVRLHITDHNPLNLHYDYNPTQTSSDNVRLSALSESRLESKDVNREVVSTVSQYNNLQDGYLVLVLVWVEVLVWLELLLVVLVVMAVVMVVLLLVVVCHMLPV